MAIILDPIGGAPAAGGGGRTGALSTTSAVDIILVTESEALQRIAMTAIDKSVFLPTGIPAGPSVFMIANTGDIPFSIRSPQGAFLATAEADTVSIVSKYGDDSWSVAKLTSENNAPGVSVSNILVSARPIYYDMAMISSTKAIVVYGGTVCEAAILTIANGIVTIGAPTTITTEYRMSQICVLSSTQALISWTTAAQHGVSAILSITGDVVALEGTPVTYTTTYAWTPTLTVMSPTQVIVVYKHVNGTSRLVARVLDIAGTVITPSGLFYISPDPIQYWDVAKVDGTRIVVSYNAGTQAASVVVSLSGSTLTTGTPIIVISNAVAFTAVVKLTDTSLLALARDKATATWKLVGNILTLSGTTLTAGPLTVISDTHGYYVYGTSLTSDKVVVSYDQANVEIYNNIVDISLTGTIIAGPQTLGTLGPVNSQLKLHSIDSTHALVVYEDGGNSLYMTNYIVEAGAL